MAGVRLTLVCVIGLAVLLVVLNQATAPDFALHVPSYVIPLVGKYLCFAMLALAVDLVWGYVGILTLGHAAFFALGGYAMGMYLMREIGTRGVYGNPMLPDFMVFLNWTELPWYWYGFNWFPFAMLMVMVVPGVLAFVFGYLAFRSRVSGVYLSIITQALTYALLLAFFRNDMGFGGNNGMTDFKDILGFNLSADSTRCTLLIITAVVLAAQFRAGAYVVVTRSRFGKMLLAVRDAESRTRFSATGPRILQAGGVRAVRGDGRHRRRAVRAAGRHHQPRRVRPRQLDRGGDLGRGRRPRHADRRHSGRGAGELRQDLADRRAARGLAVRPRRAVHLRHPVHAARHHRAVLAAADASGACRPDTGIAAGAGVHCVMIEPIGAVANTLLYVSGVSVTFDGFRALNNLSLVLAPGEMRAVIGPNGAGKTTMMDVITGKTRPNQGQVVFRASTDLTRLDEPAIASLGIGRKFQKPTVFEAHTVWDNLLLALAGLPHRAKNDVRAPDGGRADADRGDPRHHPPPRSPQTPRR